ncbi:tRNA (cytidine(32)/uridine(32)-2'-O)-methyltransferase (EC [Olavius algarvensis associated proteobacterium Delta 3]|nr:tRNA (cytidine(32)/uridine(32)-2'-O)-methyltransferase (EC [Olavius algarvensis associated proteobacterium Delta 3]
MSPENARKIHLNNISIVLHKPRFPENIGASARAMCNMGILRLIVIQPENFDMIRVLRMATQAAAAVATQIQVYETLDEALAPYQCVVGTTARVGSRRKVMASPETLARDLVPISQKNRVAILFGPEGRGLTNEETRRCHHLLTIPTAGFSSLNLSQAVMVVCHELFKATSEKKETPLPRLANRHELDGMYAQLRDILVRINYINPENPDYWMNKIRHFGTRIQLRAREVSIIRGICRQINWYAEKRYRDGREDAAGATTPSPEDPPETS